MIKFAFILLGIIIQVQAQTVQQFNSCLTKNCGEIACWTANNSTNCNQLLNSYTSCTSQSNNCQIFNANYTSVINLSNQTMVSYVACFNDCSNKISNYEYLYYYYKCYSQCSDNSYSLIIKNSILALFQVVFLLM
ncbi:hypothetical protein ABPG72_014870 [Tetrahymena utriculariae]